MKIWLILLGLIFLTIFGVWAESSPPSILPDNLFCQPLFTASLESTELTGQVGRPTMVRIQLEPDSIPSGHFIVSLADVVKGPDGPQADILTGYPEIKVTPKVVGDYQIMVRVSLIIKSSCAGAEASTLLKQMVHLIVMPE